MEFECDSAADMQGKLATDQVQENAEQNMLDESDRQSQKEDDEMSEASEDEEKAERTRVQAAHDKSQQNKKK